jgi:hypothetical protein
MSARPRCWLLLVFRPLSVARLSWNMVSHWHVPAAAQPRAWLQPRRSPRVSLGSVPWRHRKTRSRVEATSCCPDLRSQPKAPSPCPTGHQVECRSMLTNAKNLSVLPVVSVRSNCSINHSRSRVIGNLCFGFSFPVEPPCLPGFQEPRRPSSKCRLLANGRSKCEPKTDWGKWAGRRR